MVRNWRILLTADMSIWQFHSFLFYFSIWRPREHIGRNHWRQRQQHNHSHDGAWIRSADDYREWTTGWPAACLDNQLGRLTVDLGLARAHHRQLGKCEFYKNANYHVAIGSNTIFMHFAGYNYTHWRWSADRRWPIDNNSRAFTENVNRRGLSCWHNSLPHWGAS